MTTYTAVTAGPAVRSWAAWTLLELYYRTATYCWHCPLYRTSSRCPLYRPSRCRTDVVSLFFHSTLLYSILPHAVYLLFYHVLYTHYVVAVFTLQVCLLGCGQTAPHCTALHTTHVDCPPSTSLSAADCLCALRCGCSLRNHHWSGRRTVHSKGGGQLHCGDLRTRRVSKLRTEH